MKSHVYRISKPTYNALCRAIYMLGDDEETHPEALRRVGMDERLFRAEHALFIDGKRSFVTRIPDDLSTRLVDAFFPWRSDSPFVTCGSTDGFALLLRMYRHTYGERLSFVLQNERRNPKAGCGGKKQ